MTLHVRGPLLAIFTSFVLAVTGAACGTSEEFVTFGGGTKSGNSFQGADSAAPAPEVALCASNECPPDRTTCPNDPFPCTVDLRSDNENCGACGRRCPQDGEFGAVYSGITECIEGECRLTCIDLRADCNGLVEDGCEASITNDINNCGECGVVCTDVCTEGKCGCIPGYSFCDGRCVNYLQDPQNCGDCGNACPLTDQPDESWHAQRTCVTGTCNELACVETYGADGISFWADCNDNLNEPSGDGCETKISDNIENCGACGNRCAPDQICATVGNHFECVCPCGSSCFDVNSDINNCGACNVACPGDRRSVDDVWRLGANRDPAHGKPICDQGVCDYQCTPNWADCDGNIQNGCETNLMDDPSNCGSCGLRCEGTDAQPCLEGKCAMKECEETR